MVFQSGRVRDIWQYKRHSVAQTQTMPPSLI